MSVRLPSAESYSAQVEKEQRWLPVLAPQLPLAIPEPLVAASNLLVVDGRLSAVIDFGCSAVGDPACDLAIAWTFFDEPTRAAFSSRLDLDAGTWARGRGWALWKALIVLARFGATNAAGEDEEALRAGWNRSSRQVIDEVLAEHRSHADGKSALG